MCVCEFEILIIWLGAKRERERKKEERETIQSEVERSKPPKTIITIDDN